MDETAEFKSTFVELASKAKANPDAREDFCAFLLPHIERLAFHHLKHQEDLRDDVAQESMISLLAVDMSEVRHPRAYMATTVRRTAMRLAQKDHPHDELHEGIDDENDGLENFENMELMERLAEVIDGMKSRCRRLLNMFTFKDGNDSDLADELEMKVAQVPAARYACLKSLKSKLENKSKDLYESLSQL